VDGDVLTAQYASLVGMTTNSKEDTLYMADAYYRNIRRLDLVTLVMTTIAGYKDNFYADGVGTAAGFVSLSSLSFDLANTLYVADRQCVRSVTVFGFGTVSTVAGLCGGESMTSVDGDGTNAVFASVDGICVNTKGDGAVYVSDIVVSSIRRVSTVSPYTVTTLVASALLNPTYLVAHVGGEALYEVGNFVINKVQTVEGSVSPVAGVLGVAAASLVDGVGSNALFGESLGLAIDLDGQYLYNADVIDVNGDTLYTVRRVVTSTGEVVTLASYLDNTAPRKLSSVDRELQEVAFHASGLVASSAGPIYMSDALTSSIMTLSTGKSPPICIHMIL